MNSLRSTTVKSAVYASLLGALVALVLYVLSTWFFNAKNKQTLIQSTELGKVSDGEVVFPIGAQMPELSFADMSSQETYTLSKDPLKIKIVNFWASWCEPCVEEFSSFARLIRKFEGRISFVGVNEDKSVDIAREFLEAFSVDFKGLTGVYFGFDEGKALSDRYGILALPESFLIDPDGKLIRRVSGFEKWDSPGAIEYFESLLKKYEGQ